MTAKPQYLLNTYQLDAMKTAIYPDEIREIPEDTKEMLHRLSYVALGLAGEAGEFANKVKKLFRDSGGYLTEERREGLAKELGGVLWYLAASSKELGYALSDIADMNRVQLANRRAAGTLKGSGDYR